MAALETLLALLAVCVALAAISQKLNVPVAAALILAGCGLAFVPGLPQVALDPELALALFLPPLLQASAYRTDWPSFKANLRPILLLALGAVVFTAFCVAVVAKLLVPALPWWAAVALGAIVSPPDAVAAKAVLRRLSLPRQLVTVLEGESLINDASALVLYRFAVGAVVAGGASLAGALGDFALAAIGGVALGYGIGRIAMWVFARLEETLLDIATSFLAAFAAYFAAEALHASGVLAAVTCGLVLGRQQHLAFTARTRLASAAVWGFVEFVLESLVFMLIGLQLRAIVERLAAASTINLAGLAVAVAATLIISRFVWMFPAAWLPSMLSSRVRKTEPRLPWQHVTVLSWAGMRGVVSLAAALALPVSFPARDLIVFLAFSAILATLVLQGTTLGWVIRRLGVEESANQAPVAAVTALRAEVAAAAHGAVQQMNEETPGATPGAAAEVETEFAVRAERASTVDNSDVDTHGAHADALQLRLTGIDAARAKLAERADDLDAGSGRTLEEELDLEEQKIRRALGEGR